MATTYDLHAHVVPPTVVADLRSRPRHGVELLVDHDGNPRMRIGNRVTTAPIRDELLDLGGRLAAMDRMRVDVQVISPFIDTTAYALGRDDAVLYARWVNTALADLAASEPERLLALGTVPLAYPHKAAEELRHAVVDLGLIGCEIATTVNDDDLDVRGLDPFWDAAAELGCLVLLHPYRSLAGRPLHRYFLHNLVGNPAESTVAIAHLILSGTLERHPGLRLCVVHGGGFLPYQIGRLDRGFRARPDLVATHLTRSPSEWARTLLFDTVTHSATSLRFLLEVVGSSQVVLGSDYPFEMGDPDPVSTVERIPDASLADCAAILGGNAASLLASVRR